mmetsp:Transcript_528/g.1138  ORF Transcript_528/g.1138 Transcript_528/m.1138 type:complete len:215 (-) Transcript_528:1721-2365(-)
MACAFAIARAADTAPTALLCSAFFRLLSSSIATVRYTMLPLLCSTSRPATASTASVCTSPTSLLPSCFCRSVVRRRWPGTSSTAWYLYLREALIWGRGLLVTMKRTQLGRVAKWSRRNCSSRLSRPENWPSASSRPSSRMVTLGSALPAAARSACSLLSGLLSRISNISLGSSGCTRRCASSEDRADVYSSLSSVSSLHVPSWYASDMSTLMMS